MHLNLHYSSYKIHTNKSVLELCFLMFQFGSKRTKKRGDIGSFAILPSRTLKISPNRQIYHLLPSFKASHASF